MKLLPPLVDKELAEQAARRRTYIVRVLYASVLFLAFCLLFRDQLAGRQNPVLFGTGEHMYELLVGFQFAWVFIFLPATMSGVVTSEKERNLLPLVLVTDLRPGQIILQKYVGHLIPMFTFLLLALPLLAISYGFGGVSSSRLSAAAYLLFVTCLQVGAFSIMFSAYCQTSAEAFICSYIGSGLFYFFAVICVLTLNFFGIHVNWDGKIVFAFLPPFILGDTAGRGFRVVAFRSIPALLSTVVFLLLARRFLVSRASVSRRTIALQVLKRLDRFWRRVNRFIGGIVLIKDRRALPGDEPIVWREVTRKSLGRLSYLVRILLIIEIPVLVIGVGLIVSIGPTGQLESMSFAIFALWFIAVFAVAVRAANSVSSERSNGTLELLLASPLSGRRIVAEKTRGLRRLLLVLVVPFLSLFLMEGWWEAWSWMWRERLPIRQFFTYLVPSLLSVVIYLAMFYWFGFWVGLKVRKRSYAIIGTVAAIVLWNVLPIILLAAAADCDLFFADDPPLSYLLLLSPASMLVLCEYQVLDELFGNAVWLPIVLNFCWYGFILCLLRFQCLRKADRYLRRAGPQRRKRLPAPG